MEQHTLKNVSKGGRKPTYLASATSILTSVLTSVKAVSVVPSGGDKTDVLRGKYRY
jgi:hypothetical protein